ncbi:MAG: protein kinase, partial [Candidatus Mcinerneyibacterium aminivorans]
MQNINNRFDIIKEIGKGEFGVIYKVKDKFAPDYGIKALKIFNSDKIDKDNLKYFKKEFINLRNNELPCVVQVSEFSKIYHIDGRRFHGSYYFYTMEYLKGQNLSNYSFFNKKEKIKIFNRINFNLKYLHKNDYMHGDLSDKNIFITSDRNIIFLDLMDLGSKKEDNEMFKYLLDKYNVLMENFNEDYSEKINPKRFLQNLKNRFNPSVRYNSEVLQQLNNQLDKITSNEKESFIINYRNCRKDYFKAILKYIGGNLQTEGYSVINLFLNPSPYSFLKQLLLIITQKAKDKEILKEYKKFKNFLVNKEKSEFENFELSQIKLLTSELLEKLSLKSKQVIVLDSFDMIDEKSSQILQYLFKYYSGKQIVFFINNDRYSPDKKENSFRYIDANLNPLHEKYSKTNYSKLKRLFYPFDIETIIDTLSKNKYYDIFEIINFVVNQFNYKKKITVKMLENIDIEKAVKSKNAILGHYLNRERYEKLLGYINYMNKPIKIKYFRDILKEEYKILIDELINSQIISFFDNRRLTIKRKNILIYLKEYFIEKSPEYLKDIKNEIIRIYEKYENEISFDEKTTLIQLYAGKKNYKKAADILWKDFIKNRELNVEVFEQNLGSILNKIFTEQKPKKFEKEDIEAVFRIAYAKFYYNNESRKQTEVLDKINQDDIDSNGILFELNYSLFFNYFDLYKKQKIKEYYHKLKRISDELSFEDELKFVYAGFRFFQYFNKYKKMKKFLNQFFTLIKDKDDQYTKDYLRGLNSLYTYYSNYEKNDKKAYNTVNLFLKKAKEFGSDFYTYSAYTNLGVYMHYHGQKKKAYEAFKQALIYAKKSSDFSILPTAYNNM